MDFLFVFFLYYFIHTHVHRYICSFHEKPRMKVFLLQYAALNFLQPSLLVVGRGRNGLLELMRAAAPEQSVGRCKSLCGVR